ncbi:DUF6587 family protein [Thermomonas sp.]|uniref:DUF6587 family protein n=1 Tax=Thermomonas sp. TaxID=1971895 RepID=UPI00248967A2|nr:DUF6587 family protein [Thermomonas sp.]MDI1252978.1 hypothetical protein [Thermomonas sp.]
MSVGLLAQYLLIALAVIASLIVVMRKQFPGATRRLRIAIALSMLREDSPDVLKKMGRWIAPEPAAGGKDCGGCNGCD